jgi:hypothetical protein
MTTWQPKAIKEALRIFIEHPVRADIYPAMEAALRAALPLIEVTMDMEKAGKDATRWAMTSTQLADACGAMLRACASEGKDQ